MIELECKQCGGSFKRYPNKKNSKFCNEACMAKWYSENLTGEDNPAWNGGKQEKKCLFCGDTFKVPRAKKETAKFCSRECHGEWKSEKQIGENHHNWKGGYGDYRGPDWRKQRQRARERDDRCQACGLSNAAHKVIFDEKISVHHVVPYRISEDNSLNNLIVLCATCHSSLEGKTHREPL